MSSAMEHCFMARLCKTRFFRKSWDARQLGGPVIGDLAPWKSCMSHDKIGIEVNSAGPDAYFWQGAKHPSTVSIWHHFICEFVSQVWMIWSLFLDLVRTLLYCLRKFRRLTPDNIER